MLSIEQMRQREKANLRLESVPIPEWDAPNEPPASVNVRNISATDRDSMEYEVEVAKREKLNNNIRARLFVRVVCDAEGKRLYKDTDAAEVGTWDGKVLDRVWDAGWRLGRFSDKEKEELEKNSVPGPNGSSS